jgi:hypothetical protein
MIDHSAVERKRDLLLPRSAVRSGQIGLTLHQRGVECGREDFGGGAQIC